MKNPYFEVHVHENQKIPFIYRKNIERTKSSSATPGWHPAVEISRCVSGSGRIICNTISYDFNEGDIFIVNSNTLHSIVSDSHLVFDCLIIDDCFFADNDIDIKGLTFENSIKDENLLHLFIKAGDVFINKAKHHTARLRCSILNLVLYICDNYSNTVGGFTFHESSSVEMTKIAIGYINSHLTERLTLDILARQTGLSKYHLCHEFKKVTEHTVVSYINICRCKKAARMLMSGKASVSEACYNSGFENLSYFTRTFKKYYGVSPSTYKK